MNHGYPPALARAQLDALAPLATRFSEAAADLDYFELVYSVRLRAPRTGLAASRRLLERAERLQLEESAVDARQLRAGLFALVGRWRELAAELEALRQDDERRLPCARARVLANLGWYGLLGHRQDPAQFPDSPRGPLLEAAAYYRSACPLAARVANVELNLGWEALFRGDLGEAHRRLDAATTSWPQPDFRTSLEQHHLAAELHLAEGELAAAVEAFSGVSIRAKAAGLPTIGWRASMALGEAWAGRGDRARAIEAYTAAADQLDALAEQVPFGEGRDTLLFDRAEGAERLVGTLSAAGDGLGAIEAIRRARRGALRWAQVETDLLHQRLDPERQADRARLQAARAALAESIAASWALPADALAEERRAASARSEEALSALNALLRPAPAGLPPLAPPEPDTGALFVHPLGSGMVAWLWTPAGRFTATASSATPGALAALSPHLGGLRRLTVYATPGLEALDWSAWPVGGRPLYTQTTVVYPADAPGRRVGPPDPGRRAIVLADPAGGLPGAQTEGREVARVLAGQGFQGRGSGRRGNPRTGREAAQSGRRPAPLWRSRGAGRGWTGIDGGIPPVRRDPLLGGGRAGAASGPPARGPGRLRPGPAGQQGGGARPRDGPGPAPERGPAGGGGGAAGPGRRRRPVGADLLPTARTGRRPGRGGPADPAGPRPGPP
jgi:hypothetical protein